ncbi:formate dehydrogenase subunit gamma [Palleronia sp. LCG004]|uniref:formate dehydrogenase subunit gamma n=1 Tax=Palleronia sp. LCG004 TaxID=3079304 RepID=UPI0029433969|nr:formate dehydrogenase subunit gamma [Palleronia sp. LCG004]WOI58148.1 formate dehydrogenase subunit gamma [Palleronia sp. LCG004]
MTQPSVTEVAAAVDEIVRAHATKEGPLLPILHDVQARFGHIPETAMQPIAEALNIGRAEVHGVVSFYHDFHTEPRGRHIVRVCRSEACQARGGLAVEEGAQRALGLGWNETSADGRVTLEAVYCLGLCASGPNATIDDRPAGRLDADRIAGLLSELG